MKKNVFVSLSLLFVLLCSIFGPFIRLNDEVYAVYEIVNKSKNIAINIMLLLPLLTYFCGCICILFEKKINVLCRLIFLLFLSSGIMFSLTRTILVSNSSLLQNVSLSVAPILLSIVSFIATLYYIRNVFDSFTIAIEDIVEIAIFVSFAVVLDLAIFKIRIGANGGSISLAMLPLMVIALRKGFVKGFIASGLIFGILSCLLDGYGIVYYPFDYLLGFGSIAIMGLFKKFIFNDKKGIRNYIILSVSVILVFVFRTLFSTISGIIYFNLNFIESLVYQLAYVGPSSAICLVLVLLLYKPLLSINRRFKY